MAANFTVWEAQGIGDMKSQVSAAGAGEVTAFENTCVTPPGKRRGKDSTFFFVGWFRENLKSNQPPGKGDSYRKPSLLGAMLVSGKVGLNSFLLLVGFVKI